jgi:hypothetical protein
MRASARLSLGVGIVAAGLLTGCGGLMGGASTDLPGRPDLAHSLMAAATQALAQGDAATASTYFRAVHAREPDNLQAALGLMQSLRQVGSLAEANEVAT